MGEADAEEEKKKEQEEADAKKKCPGSGNACTGNECCPGYAGSNGLTFPCPDADSTYVGCESMDRQSLAQTTKMEPPSKSEASVLSLPDKDEANAEEEKRKEQEEADAQEEKRKEQEEADAQEEKR